MSLVLGIEGDNAGGCPSRNYFMILDEMENGQNVWKIQHKLGVERSGLEGFNGGVRSDVCKSLLGIVVRGIR